MENSEENILADIGAFKDNSYPFSLFPIYYNNLVAEKQVTTNK